MSTEPPLLLCPERGVKKSFDSLKKVLFRFYSIYDGLTRFFLNPSTQN